MQALTKSCKMGTSLHPDYTYYSSKSYLEILYILVSMTYHRHSLDRLNTINDSSKEKNKTRASVNSNDILVSMHSTWIKYSDEIGK